MATLSIIGSLLLGIITSLLTTTFSPVIEQVGGGTLVRIFGWCPLRRKAALAGAWTSTWHVESSRYPPAVTDDNATIRQVGNRIYGKFRALDLDCYLVGTVDSGRYITGT